MIAEFDYPTSGPPLRRGNALTSALCTNATRQLPGGFVRRALDLYLNASGATKCYGGPPTVGPLPIETTAWSYLCCQQFAQASVCGGARIPGDS